MLQERPTGFPVDVEEPAPDRELWCPRLCDVEVILREPEELLARCAKHQADGVEHRGLAGIVLANEDVQSRPKRKREGAVTRAEQPEVLDPYLGQVHRDSPRFAVTNSPLSGDYHPLVV